MSDIPPEEKKSPLQEITQPFIDLIHAPRALWGINLGYLIEGMVYFGMLGYLTIYCSEFIFQAIDGADEAAHYMVMVLTAGITISMFFLGVVADKRGVRYAIIAAFVCMLIGRAIWAGAPNVLGFEPTRPGVFAGDKISLYVTGLDTRFGVKTITKSKVIADAPDAVDVDREVKLDLSAGEGIAPQASLESRFVAAHNVRIVKGKDQQWTVTYGAKPVQTRLLLNATKYLGIRPGAIVSLSRGYIAAHERTPKAKKATAKKSAPTSQAYPPPQESEAGDAKEDAEKDDDPESSKYEYVIRSHWASDLEAINTLPVDFAAGDGRVPDQSTQTWHVRLSRATIVEGKGRTWQVRYGAKPVTARLLIESSSPPPLRPGAVVSIADAEIAKSDHGSEKTKGASKSEYVIKAQWPDGFSAVDVSACGDAAALAARIAGQLKADLAVDGPTGLSAKAAARGVRISFGVLEARKSGDPSKSRDAIKQIWSVRCGETGETVDVEIDGADEAPLAPGVRVALANAEVVPDGRGGRMLRAQWPADFSGIDTYGCATSPFRNMVTPEERQLLPDARKPVAKTTAAMRAAPVVTIDALRKMKDGRVDVVLRDVPVTYVRNGGYFLQEDENGPAIAVFVSPFWSALQIATLLGMLLVVIGYGMYQPAAYAGVRKFTTPKTAAMGFAMLYAVMNLGGWLPTFAFLLRDRHYLGLGIPGVFWVYTGFTLLALLATIIILNRRTVIEAEATAKAETERIKAEEARSAADAGAETSDPQPDQFETDESSRVRPHMWLFWIGAIALFLFKSEAPWWYSWQELAKEWNIAGFASIVVWRWILAALIFVSPILIALIPPAKAWIAKHPLENAKFSFFIFALIPVQTLFTYNWLVLPPYIKRAYEGWIGQDFEIAANANPLLVFVAVPIITALTQKANVYNMMIWGTLVMASPAFILAIGPYWWTLALYILIMTLGEAMWQPRFLQYAAEIAPEGRTGEYMGVAQFPWFLTKVLVPLLYSGMMMDKYCPAEGPKNTEFMWFIFGCIAIVTPILLLLAKGWVGKHFQTKHAGG